MIALLLANWRYAAMGVLAAACAALWGLYSGARDDLAEFRARTRAEAALAKERAEDAKRHHQQIVEDVSNAWNDRLPDVRTDAVTRYIAAHPGVDLRPAGQCVLFKPTHAPLIVKPPVPAELMQPPRNAYLTQPSSPTAPKTR